MAKIRIESIGGKAYLLLSMLLYINYRWEYATIPDLVKLINLNLQEQIFNRRLLIPILAKPFYEIGIPTQNIFVFFDFASIALLVIGMLKLLSKMENSNLKYVLASLPIYLLYSINVLPKTLNIFYPFDLCAAAFLLWLFIHASNQKSLLFCFIFALATLNRETSILALLFITLINNTNHKKYILLFCLLFWFGSKISLAYYFPSNQSIAASKFLSNYNYLLRAFTEFHPRVILVTFSYFTFTWLILINKNKFIYTEKIISLFLIIHLLILIFVANIFELRIYTEVVGLYSILLISRNNPESLKINENKVQ